MVDPVVRALRDNYISFQEPSEEDWNRFARQQKEALEKKQPERTQFAIQQKEAQQEKKEREDKKLWEEKELEKEERNRLFGQMTFSQYIPAVKTAAASSSRGGAARGWSSAVPAPSGPGVKNHWYYGKREEEGRVGE